MRSVFYHLDVAPYGSEKAYGLLNAAAVSVKIGVYNSLGKAEDKTTAPIDFYERLVKDVMNERRRLYTF